MSQQPLQKFIEASQVDHASPTNVTATDTLEVYETLVLCDTTDGAITLTLPNVSEAIGKVYSIKLETDGGTDVTIQDGDESKYWEADITLDDAGDGVLLYSDGQSWWPIGYIPPSLIVD